MEMVELGQRFDAPARETWRIVGDFGGDVLTRGYVARVEVRGQGIGAERIYHLEPQIGSGSVVERLDEHDDALMRMRYSMTDNGSLPWTEYRGEVRVIAAGPSASMVSLRTWFLPIGQDAATLKAMSKSNIEAYFANLARALESRA